MPGLGSFALAGAVGGIGESMIEQARQKREDKLAALKRQQELEDYGRRRSDQLEDYNRARSDHLADDQRGQDRRDAKVQRNANVYRSLWGTESGGNFGARNSEGYMGRSQFGQDRLNDWANATGARPITPEQFRQDPNLQKQVEQWHFGDINTYIDENDLLKYEGQNIGGVQVSRSGMIAMAHLGGKDGMRRYLQSGGKYNPADSNGTSLSDYARTHGGLSTDMNDVWEAIADPDTPESVRKDLRAAVSPKDQSRLEGEEWVRGDDGREVLMGRVVGANRMAPYIDADGKPISRAVDPGKPDEYQRYVQEEEAAGRPLLSRVDYARAKRGKGFSVTLPDGTSVQMGGNSSENRIQPASTDSMIASIDGILNDPSLETSTGILSPLQAIPGTPQRRFAARAKQLEGQAFLQAFESLKGGGQITEVEGQKATQAIGRLDTAQSPADYRAALTELREILVEARNRPNGWASSQAQGGEARSGSSVTAQGISQMRIEQLNQLDVGSLTLEQIDAAENRYKQLRGGR